MERTSSGKLALAGLAAAAAGAALTLAIIAPGESAPTTGQASAVVEPTGIVRTTLPGLEPAQGEPDLVSIRTARPAVGDVIQAAGPFDQRIVLQDLAFDGSAVSGVVLITSDVSELLELQVLAGFYDGQGNLLGTGRFVHHDAGAGHAHSGSEPEAFAIAVPEEAKGRAVSAAVGVPVLVNE